MSRQQRNANSSNASELGAAVAAVRLPSAEKDSLSPVSGRSRLLWILLLTAACLAPFLSRPFFVDDTLFLKAAEQIQKHPADFYGFKLRWFFSESPMIENAYNPPLASYYLALVAAAGGWREWALHLAFVVPALLAAWGMFALARLFCTRPMRAAVTAILTPVFLISATTVMCDLIMLAFWVWSMVWFERGWRRRSVGAFAASGLLAGLAFLGKFPALALVPLLGAYGLLRARDAGEGGLRSGVGESGDRQVGEARFGWWILAPLLPLVFVAGYEWVTWRFYGHGHLLHAAAYAQGENVHRGLVDKLAIGLSFLGGCFLPLVFYPPSRFGGQDGGGVEKPLKQLPSIIPVAKIALGMGLVLGLLFVLPQLAAFKPFLSAKEGMRLGLALQAAFFAAVGIYLLWLPLGEWWRRRDPASALLALWVLGMFVFVTMINWTVNGRSLLPIAPALGILVARRGELMCRRERASGRRWGSAVLVPVSAAAGLSLALVWADYRVARAEREVTTGLYQKYQKPGRTVWFEGHGGFQFYLERLGARPLDMSRPEIGPQDVVIIPNCAPGVSTPNLDVVRIVDAVKYQPNLYYSTMEPSLGAAFYEAVRGPLPFAAGQAKPDYCFVFARKEGH